MTNDEILNQRWKKTDKTLKDYLKTLSIYSENIIDDISEMFDSLDLKYEDLNKKISKQEQRKLDRRINEWKEQGIFNGYFAFLVTTKSIITYADLLEILIYSIYMTQLQSIKKSSKKVFKTIAEDSYKQAKRDIPTKKKKLSLTWEFIYSFLWLPSANKNWYEYLDLLGMTCQQEMYKQLLVDIQQKTRANEENLKALVRKQTNRILSINDDKFSGAMDNVARTLHNQIYIEAGKENKELQVRFIAEIDDKTTKMCLGMDKMLFYVNDWNRFYRYSDADKKDVLYTVFGLQVGINLPPITNHFHWCRSTITYQIDKDIKWLSRNKK